MPTTSTNKPVIRLHYLNNLGAIESFNFERLTVRSERIERANYKVLASSSVWINSNINKKLSSERENTFYTKVEENIKARSGWLSEEMQNELEQLVSSPVVYLDREGKGTNGLVRVTINSSTFEYKSRLNSKMFDLEIEFKIADRYRQRS